MTTEKDIRQYLHLYMGQWVQIYWSGDTLEAGYEDGRHLLSGEIYHMIMLDSKATVTLEARKLSDMTEEDSMRVFGVKNRYRLFAHGEGEPSLHISERFLFTPAETVGLLKNGFDLFGLIESGLAIDKKTL